MIKKLLVVLLFATAALSAHAESDVQNIAGVTYRLTTAIDIANSATGRVNTPEATDSISSATPQWLQWQSSKKASAVSFMASLKGRYQFGRDGRHHPSQVEHKGLESGDILQLGLPQIDALLIKGLRVGARVSF